MSLNSTEKSIYGLSNSSEKNLYLRKAQLSKKGKSSVAPQYESVMGKRKVYRGIMGDMTPKRTAEKTRKKFFDQKTPFRKRPMTPQEYLVRKTQFLLTKLRQQASIASKQKSNEGAST